MNPLLSMAEPPHHVMYMRDNQAKPVWILSQLVLNRLVHIFIVLVTAHELSCVVYRETLTSSLGQFPAYISLHPHSVTYSV